jgi:hypothetical protein
MKNFNSAPRTTCAMVWLFAFMAFFSFGQTSQVVPLPLNVVPFSYNGNAIKPRLQTFRSSIIFNPVVYSLPQAFINDFPNGQIDFGDGNGFVSLGTQTTRSINYSSFSEKSIKFKKTSTVPNAEAKTLVRINVKSQIAAYVKPDEVWTVGVQSGVSWTRPASCANAYPVGSPLFNTEQKTAFNDGSIGKANVYIKYGKENGVSRTRLAKPIIFIDGIDFSSYNYKITDNTINNTTDATNKVIRYGDTGWDVLWTGTDESKLDGSTDREVFGNYPTAFSRLINDGYDFVFVDFERGADYIQKNGLLLMEVIRQVNIKKVQNDCRAKNVVIGASMGGQVARWALKKMEDTGESHDSHTYVSFDSPQKGAHIPLSIQAAAFWASRSGINTGSPSLWQKLNFPAARQLLFDNLGSAERAGKIAVGRWEVSGLVGFGDIQFTPDNFKCLRDNYVAEMSALQYPQQTRNVAIACGGFSGSPQGYINGQRLFDMNIPTDPGPIGAVAGFNGNAGHFKIWSGNGAITNLAVVKAAGCNGVPVPSTVGLGGRGSAQQFMFAAAFPTAYNQIGLPFGLGTTDIPCSYSTLYVQNIQDIPYFDNAPGSYRQDLVGLKQLIEDESATVEGTTVNLNGLPSETTKKLCFIPTLSAFDIQQTVSDQSLYQNFTGNTNTPFAEIFAPASNLKHVEIDNDIINFLLKQIKISEITTLPKTLISRNYNFANNSKKTLFAVDIGTGGIVRVNGAGNAGFGDEINNANPSEFEVGTGTACGQVVVNVNSGGQLKIGEDSRVGTLKVTTGGSVVEILSGGTLKIDPNSQLIIDNGARLIIDANANINLGLSSKILIKKGGELIINGNFNFTGQGNFQFDQGHVFTTTSNLNLTGSGNTSKFFVLSDAPTGTENVLKLTGHSFGLSNALIYYGTNSQIDLTDCPEVGFSNCIFSGYTMKKALNVTNSDAFSVGGCNFSHTTNAVFVNGNTEVSVFNSNFSNVMNCISVKGLNPYAQIFSCTFNYSSYNVTSGIACRLENGYADIGHNTFIGSGKMNNITALELKNAALYASNEDKISDFKTGINADISNDIEFVGTEISNCETGINIPNGGVYMRNCSKLLKNMTGIKGTNVRLSLEEGFNVYENANNANSLLFDICYSSTTPIGDVYALNSFWVGGFNNMKFNLIYGCSGGVRRKVKLYNELTIQCDYSQYEDECGKNPISSDGLNPSTVGPIECFRSGGGVGTSDALKVQKPTNPTTTKADNDKFTIYPNPASETVKLDIDNGNYVLKVLNTVGQTIFAQNTEGSLSVDVSTWTNGIYLFELTNKTTNKQQRNKVVVQH